MKLVAIAVVLLAALAVAKVKPQFAFSVLSENEAAFTCPSGKVPAYKSISSTTIKLTCQAPKK
jgi:hypothetical protein